MYTLRITPPEEDQEILNTIPFIFSEPYIISREVANQPHYHIYGTLSLSESQTRRKLNDKGYKGNKSFSLSKAKKSKKENLAYVIKDGNYTNYGFSDEDIQEALLYDTTVKSEIEEKKSKGNDAQQIIQILKETYDRTPGTDEIKSAVAEFYVQRAKEFKFIRRNFILSARDTVEAYFYGKSVIEAMLDR